MRAFARATLLILGSGLIVGITESTASAAAPAGYEASPNWTVSNTTASTTLPGNAAALGNAVASNVDAPAQSMMSFTDNDGVDIPRVLPDPSTAGALSTACLAGKPVGQQVTCATYKTTITLPHPVVDPIISLAMAGGGNAGGTWCTAGWNNIAFSSVNGAAPAAGVVAPRGSTGNFVFSVNALTLPQSYITANACSAPTSGNGFVDVQLMGLISSFSLDNVWMVEVTQNPSNVPVGGTSIGGTVFNVNVPSADLSIAKTGPTAVAPNGTITWTINVANNGPSPSHGFVIHDAIPANVTGATLASSPAGCALTGTDLICSQAPPGCTATQNPTVTTWAELSCSPSTAADAPVLGAGAGFGPITLTGTAPSAGGSVVTNTATVSGADSDPNPANNTSTSTTTVNPVAPIHVPGTPSLAIAKTSDAAPDAKAGDVFHYMVTVTNTGTGDYAAVHPASMTDDLSRVLDDAAYNGDARSSAGSPPSFAGDKLEWSGPLAAGQSVTLTYSVTLNLDGDKTIANVACFPPSEVQPGTTNCAQTVWSAQHVVVTKSVVPVSGSPVSVGQELAYSLTFENDGAEVAQIDRVEDIRGVLDDATLTRALTVSDRAWNVGPLQNGTAPVKGALEPGQSVTIHYAAKVNPDGQRGDNLLVSTLVPQGSPPVAAQAKGCPSQAEACVENPVSSWSVTLTADKAAAAPGDTVSYTARQTNTGAVAIQNGAQTSIDLGGILDGAHYRGDASAVVDYSFHRLSWSTSLAVGEQRTITYSVTVKLAAQANHRLRSVVDGGSNCQPGSPAPECRAETVISTSPTAAPGVSDAPTAGPQGLPAVTKTADRSPNWAMFVGGLAALTAGVLANLSRVRARHRFGRTPSGSEAGL